MADRVEDVLREGPAPRSVRRRIGAVVAVSPAVAGLALGAVAAVLAYIARYWLIEPELIGALCQEEGAPIWCPARTGFIMYTEVNGFGITSLLLAGLLLVLRGRPARIAGIAAATFGGAGLFLYNATWSSAAVVIALVGLARHGRRPAKARELAAERRDPGQGQG